MQASSRQRVLLMLGLSCLTVSPVNCSTPLQVMTMETPSMESPVTLFNDVTVSYISNVSRYAGDGTWDGKWTGQWG